MVIVDANVLIFAYSVEAPRHEISRKWLERAFLDPQGVGFTWMVLLAFLRMMTSRSMVRVALPMQEACAVLDSWLEQESAALISPGPKHWAILQELLRESDSKSDLVNHAHLAALAIENGAALCSFDRDFRRFPKLRLIIPE